MVGVIIGEEYLVLLFVFLSLMFILSQIFGVFDVKGGLAAVVLGAFISVVANFNWLILLVVFAFSSHLATRAWIKQKKKSEQQEGIEGERGYSNVIYAGVLGFLIASFQGITTTFNLPVVPYFFLFAISFAVINSDTFASEIGILDKKTYLITNFKRVEPGVNGGISLTGTIASVLGALIIGITYSLLKTGVISPVPIIIITSLGFAGSIIDSILGATLENRSYLSKGQVNLLSTVIIVAAAVPIAF